MSRESLQTQFFLRCSFSGILVFKIDDMLWGGPATRRSRKIAIVANQRPAPIHCAYGLDVAIFQDVEISMIRKGVLTDEGCQPR